MVNEVLLQRLLSFEADALSELEGLCGKNQSDCVDTAWAFLLSAGEDGRHVVGGWLAKATELLIRLVGQSEVENRILRDWQRMDEQARTNIAYDVFCNHALLSTELGVNLVSSPDSTSGSRMEIIGNLVMKSIQRNVDNDVINDLLDRLSRLAVSEDRDEVRDFIERTKADLDFRNK